MYEEENKKEIINGYEIDSSIWVGSKQYVFGIHQDKKEPNKYFTARKYSRDIFNIVDNGTYGGDYFEVMKAFIQNISEALQEMEQQRDAIGLEDISCLEAKDLLPVDYTMNIQGRIVAIDEKYLADGYKDISHQLYFVDSGNGSMANSRGRACFSYNLYTGEMTRIERFEIIGIVSEEKLPDFAKQTLEKIKEEIKKEKEDRDDR